MLTSRAITFSFIYPITARPDVQILVNAETINDTDYQSVSCSAVGGRPTPQISWLVNSLSPSEFLFTVDTNETHHSDGTSTLSSIVHLPTHLLEDDSVTCVVQHPTLPQPQLTTVQVETYGTLTFTASVFLLLLRRDTYIQLVNALCHVLFSNCASWLSRNSAQLLSPPVFSHTGCSFSLCCTHTLTDHKSRRTERSRVNPLCRVLNHAKHNKTQSLINNNITTLDYAVQQFAGRHQSLAVMGGCLWKCISQQITDKLSSFFIRLTSLTH